MDNKIRNIFRAFLFEFNRISEEPETEQTGHPFVVCTNIAAWLKENFFPDAMIMGYTHEKNPSATIGQAEGGHDFLMVTHKGEEYIVDFWPIAIGEQDVPIYLNLRDKRIGKFYGDPSSWEPVNTNN